MRPLTFVGVNIFTAERYGVLTGRRQVVRFVLLGSNGTNLEPCVSDRTQMGRSAPDRVQYEPLTPRVGSVTLLVVQLSTSFGEFWGQLSRDLGVDLRVVGPDDVGLVPPEVAAVVLAAGGDEMAALDWLDRHAVPPPIPVLAVGADPGRRIAAATVRRGATDYFALPEDLEVLHNATDEAVARHRAGRQRDNGVGDVKPEAFSTIVGESTALKATLTRAGRLLPHGEATALIVGDTGTGKELLARAIHEGGPRRRAPFVAVNCAALPERLVESELFGHERGAFTDAHAAKPGLFELAEGGTLFLDEIGTLPVDAQAKLLRVFEDKQVRRVGGTKWRFANVRILAATNERLEERVRTGEFREDLYFRLSVVVLRLPPLRERGDDVVLIANELLRRAALQHELPEPPLDEFARRALREHGWPGNVRELRNAVERALLLSPEGTLAIDELIPERKPVVVGEGRFPFPATLDAIESAVADATLKYCDGNRSEAARRLGISRKRLRRLLSMGGQDG